MQCSNVTSNAVLYFIYPARFNHCCISVFSIIVLCMQAIVMSTIVYLSHRHRGLIECAVVLRLGLRAFVQICILLHVRVESEASQRKQNTDTANEQLFSIWYELRPFCSSFWICLPNQHSLSQIWSLVRPAFIAPSKSPSLK